MSQKKKLSEITEISSGYQFRRNTPEFSEGDIKYIQMRDVNNFDRIDIENVMNVNIDNFSSKHLLHYNDVLFKSRGTKTTSALFDVEWENAIASHQFFVIRVKKKSLLPEYLVWFMNQEGSQIYFQSNRTGSYIPNVKRKVLEDFFVFIPPIEDQKKIIEVDLLKKKYKELSLKKAELEEKYINSVLSRYLHKL